ncbi:MAG: ribosome biogenesis GTPase Der [Planctomycetes bacterium]|nr:ribosome biogenesis GTPase Der [Planctomycetota bacterium]MBL7007958.1 ribosome biogenesis GTPase Der [Planctomycetota bacterium]
MREHRPLVAIVGRPNVGKSSLFNRLLGERRAIVEPTSGVTRDRLVLPVSFEHPPLAFDLMDTGGIGLVDRADLAESVELQVLTGLHLSTAVLFLVDAREGLTLLDEHVAGLLRRAGRPVLLCANKCEGREAERNAAEFGALGFGDARPLSAQEGRGISDLLDELAEHLPPADEVPPVASGDLRIAVLGRRNTGKSSFVNALLGEQRVIVSDIPGTTRDAIEIAFEWQGRPVALVDTAGVHRRAKIANAIEFFSLTRSDQAIRHADAALLFLDLTQPLARLDQELARTIHDRYKPVVIVGTKKDLVPDLSLDDFRGTIEHKLPHLAGAPIRMVSNLSGAGLAKVMELAFQMQEEGARRIGTGELNRALEAAFERLRFRGRGEKPRAFYATQLRATPPTFLLFVNRAPLFDKEVLRAVSRELRKRLGFQRVPIRLVLRERLRSPSKRR